MKKEHAGWFALIIAVIAIVIWMNRYDYRAIDGHAIRYNRFTGKMDIYRHGTWDIGK